MQRLSVADVPTLRVTLREQLHDSADARYSHRLHCVLLVGLGLSCYEVAKQFGESPRTVERWIHRYDQDGVDGLKDHPPTGQGSRKLTHPQRQALRQELLKDPRELGYEHPRWDSTLLRAHLERNYRVTFSVRHCQRLLHQLKG